MNEKILTFAVMIFLLLLVMASYWILVRRRSRKHKAHMALAASLGHGKPIAQHPLINERMCIGCGACTIVCPEKALGLIDGVSHMVHPARCVGHGICAETCPVSAITIVLDPGSSTAGLPVLDTTFQSQVSRIYVIGELGGMALIRNAVSQGKQVVDTIAGQPRPAPASSDAYDLIIVGAGPAGLSAALRAMERGLKFVIMEKESSPGGTILNYPRQKLVLTAPLKIPYYGWLKKRELTKEELMEIWKEILQTTGLPVLAGKTLSGVRREGELLIAETMDGSKIPGRNVVLALGRRAHPRKLGVPGESSAKVTYQLLDASQYRNSSVLVVGAGDSAIEAALGLSMQKGAIVALANRGDAFAKAKPRNRDRILEAAGQKRVQVFYNTEVADIGPAEVVLRTQHGSEAIANDYVIVLAGGELPTALLEKIGITFYQKPKASQQ
jgi:thioredoxin reductase/Pyruvate/2-oxoacid:ferredoxin oxidoreductase delta subunit